MLALVLLALAAAPQYDLVIANGRVVDGTGSPWFRADVGVKGGRIAALGDLSKASARRRVDATGLVVAPGFIDMLGQSELNLLVDGSAESKIRQGVTSEVTGEGRSPGPVNDAILADWEPFLSKYGVKGRWKSLAGYWRRLERARPAINVATVVGGSTARWLVLGANAVQPTPKQLEKMERIVSRAMDEGGIGLGTALGYAPDEYAKTPELVALAKASCAKGGFYATHLRSEGDGVLDAIDEALRIGREAGCPVQIWHLKVGGAKNFGRMKEVVAKIDAARAAGVDIAADLYPYTASETGLDAIIPGWAHEGGTPALLGRLADPAARAKIEASLRQRFAGAGGAGYIMVASSLDPAQSKWMGRRLDDVAKEMKVAPEAALVKLVLDGQANVSAIYFTMSEDDVRLALAQPWTAIGSDCGALSLAGPLGKDPQHPRCFGAFARVLGHYVRDEKLLTLEEAVRKMSGLPAQRAGLWDRGLVRPGMAADLAVFDPGAVRDVGTFEDPNHYAEGMRYVAVNGRLVLDGGKMTKARPGVVLKHASRW